MLFSQFAESGRKMMNINIIEEP